MIKVKKLIDLSETDKKRFRIEFVSGEPFEFELIRDNNEWVLQGTDEEEGRGNRYSQSELEVILRKIRELNKPRRK